MQTYTVQHGDSISKISKLLYGDFSKTQEICKINKIMDCNLVQVGQLLTVPDPINVNDAQVVSESSLAKSTFAKWFPWLFVAGAAYLLGREAMKQHKKNKAQKNSKLALGNHDERKLNGVKRKKKRPKARK
jgi:LysM repeat protein